MCVSQRKRVRAKESVCKPEKEGKNQGKRYEPEKEGKSQRTCV